MMIPANTVAETRASPVLRKKRISGREDKAMSCILLGKPSGGLLQNSVLQEAYRSSGKYQPRQTAPVREFTNTVTSRPRRVASKV
jgi:hypothetical protein